MDALFLIVGKIVCYSILFVFALFVVAIICSVFGSWFGAVFYNNTAKKVKWLTDNGFVHVINSYCRREDGSKIPDVALTNMSLKQIKKIYGVKK